MHGKAVTTGFAKEASMQVLLHDAVRIECSPHSACPNSVACANSPAVKHRMAHATESGHTEKREKHLT